MGVNSQCFSSRDFLFQIGYTVSMPAVLISEPHEKAQQILDNQVELVLWEDGSSRREDIEGMLIFGHAIVDGAVMDQYPKLKVISNCGVGVDHINVDDAKDRGIVVGNTPGVLSGGTADMAFALLLAAARRLVEGDEYARGPDFQHFNSNYMLGTEVHGRTLGIIGMGRIGEEIARRGLGFNMNILYHNRKPKQIDDPSVLATYVSKDELLRESDFVVVVVPLNEQTRNLIDWEDFEKMKSSAVFVNIARGGVVNTDAITKALQTNQIYAAGLDVTEPEPLPRDHPLLQQKNLTIAPHLGSATTQTRQKMLELSLANLLNGIAGKEIVSSVMGPTG